MSVDFLEPITSRSTIQDVIYRQMRKALMSGYFDPGQTLTIAMLSETFKTSHMPVREALRRLIAENALVVLSNGSAQVPTISLADLDDVCLARIALETLATKLAASRCSPADRRTFRRLVDEHEAAAADRDLALMLTRNQELHFAVYDCCGSQLIMQFIQSLWLRFGPYMRLLSGHIGPELESGLYKPSIRHRELIEALDTGQAEAAAVAVQKDIETTQALLRKLCKAFVDGSDAAGRS